MNIFTHLWAKYIASESGLGLPKKNKWILNFCSTLLFCVLFTKTNFPGPRENVQRATVNLKLFIYLNFDFFEFFLIENCLAKTPEIYRKYNFRCSKQSIQLNKSMFGGLGKKHSCAVLLSLRPFMPEMYFSIAPEWIAAIIHVNLSPN